MANLTRLILAVIMAVFAAVPLSAQKIGIVRLSDALGAHPLTASFDIDSKRFMGGVSAPFDRNLYERSRADLETRLAEIESEEARNLGEFQAGLKKGDKEASEASYWKRKKELERQKEMVFDQLAAIRSALEFGGRTVDDSLLPDIKRIYTDVRAIIDSVARQNGCSIVFTESSPWSPDPQPPLISNTYLEAARESDPRRSHMILNRWLESKNRIAQSLSGKIRLFKPVLSPTIDLTPEVIRQVKALSIPTGGSR